MSKQAAGGARLAALDLLGGVLDGRRALGEVRPSQQDLPARDLAFATHLAYGVLRWLGALEWLAGRLLDKPLKHKDRDMHRLVLVGLFQLWQDDTPAHAAVHANAECARQAGKPWAVGLVNAVLRRFLREREALLGGLEKSENRYAHPDWLLDILRQDWPADWTSIAAQNNRAAPLWLRVNRQRTDVESQLSVLAAAGFTAHRHPKATEAVVIEPAAPVSAIPGFAGGLLSVQDPAAQLAAQMLDPQPGERVLDACAAPGGKTSHLLEYQPDIELLALDRDLDRCRLINDNLARLGLSCPVLEADAGEPAGWWDGKPFDRILLDAPCSATGVIRRHPEIKCLREPGQVSRAVEDQRRLLEALWPLLETGGMLVYATCSVLKCENHEQIHGFLSRHPDAAIAGPGDPAEGGWQIQPGEDDMDGFFYAQLRKHS